MDEDFPGGGYLFRPDGECVYQTADWSEGLAFVTLSLSTNPNSAALESRGEG